MTKQNELPKRIGQIIIFALISLMLFTNVSIAKSGPTPGGIVTDAYGNKYDLYNKDGAPGIYASNSKEVIRVNEFLNGIGQMSSNDKDAINNYIQKYSPKSPVTADMIINAAYQYPDISCPIMMAMMRQDSNFADPRINSQGITSPNGLRQRAYVYHNPGNVGDNDAGKNIDWGTWQAGVNAVAEHLNHRVVSTTPILTVSPNSGKQGTKFIFRGTGFTRKGEIEYHVKKPNSIWAGNTEYPVVTYTASSSGVFSFTSQSSILNPKGTYTIWTIDKSTGRRSNNVLETIK